MRSPATERGETLPRETSLTIEAAAYVAVCLVALGLRLLALGAAPLTPDEAGQALAAYRLAQGSPAGAQEAAAASPALLALQTLTFSLFGATDSVARLPVLLVTALAPLAFWLLRPMLGRNRALLAALLLSLSPFWTATGSMGVGRGVAGAALLFGLGFGARYALEGRRAWMLGAGAALGVALGSAPDAWAAVVLGGLGWLVVRHRLPLAQPSAWASFGLGFGVAAVLSSTTAMAHPAGLQGLLDVGGALVGGLFRREPGTLLRQVLVLGAYEPLLLLPALGVIAVVPPRDTVQKALYAWTGASLLLTLLIGVPGMGMVLVLPALAVLAAEAVERTVRWLVAMDANLRLEVAAVASVLIGYTAVALSGLAQQADTVFLLLLLTAVGIVLALLGLLWIRNGPRTAIAAGASVGLTVLALWSFANAVQGVTQRQMLPQEVLRARITPPGLTDLVRDVTDVSWSRTGFANELALVAEREVGPAAAWYLRGLRSATWVDTVAGDIDAPALLIEGTELALMTGEYVGQDYIVDAHWSPRFTDINSFLRWLLYRDAPASDVEWHRVSLWVRSAGD